MKKVLFFSELDFWGRQVQERGVTVIPLFRKIPKFLKFFRILHFKLGLPFQNIWINKVDLHGFDLIILSASIFSASVSDFISERASGVRLIYWYWNPVQLKFHPDRISDIWEKWSFDKEDCRQYGLKYNSTYYFDSINLTQRELKYDVFFIGQDKGRLSELLYFRDEITRMGLNAYFHIVSDSLSGDEKGFQKRISYEDVISIISESKVLFEYNQVNQNGLTLRSMESLFFDKKLITNNKSIKDYDIYTRENIFILEQDNIKDLDLFVQSSYVPSSKSLKERYEFDSWIKRFIDNTELPL